MANNEQNLINHKFLTVLSVIAAILVVWFTIDLFVYPSHDAGSYLNIAAVYIGGLVILYLNIRERKKRKDKETSGAGNPEEGENREDAEDKEDGEDGENTEE